MMLQKTTTVRWKNFSLPRGEETMNLMNNPQNLMSDPGYQARMLGVDRTMAAQGQLGGGGGAVAAANASGDFYDQLLATLGSLAGAPGASSAAAAQLGLTGSVAGNTLAGSGLASIGYGVTSATGGQTQMPPWLQAYLLQNGLKGATA